MCISEGVRGGPLSLRPVVMANSGGPAATLDQHRGCTMVNSEHPAQTPPSDPPPSPPTDPPITPPTDAELQEEVPETGGSNDPDLGQFM
jgi:hypothetical protein